MSDRADEPAPGLPWGLGLKIALVSAVGACLAWQVLALGVANVTEHADPATALAWRGTQSTALAVLAARSLEKAAGPNDLANARALAKRALRHGPLQESALSTLGAIAITEGQTDHGRSLLALADRVSKRDAETQLLFVGLALRDQDYAAVVSHADVLLRTWEAKSGFLIPVLVQVAADPRALEPLARHLAARPDWRSGFLSEFGAKSADAEAPFALFLKMRSGPAPPTEAETEPYFKRLVAAGLYQDAYRRWARFYAKGAPSDAFLYDGRFAGRPGPPPFNWDLANQSGVVAEFASRDDASATRGLHVAYNTASSSEFARQLLLLPPGDYVVSGDIVSDSASEPDQLGWTVKCATGDVKLLSARAGGAANKWLHVVRPLTVPPSGCEAQWLILEARAGNEFEDLSAWYANLQIRMVPPGPGPVARAP